MVKKTITITITLTGDKIPADVVKTLKHYAVQHITWRHDEWWRAYLRTKIAKSAEVCQKAKEFFSSLSNYSAVTWIIDGFYSRDVPKDIQDIVHKKFESFQQEMMSKLKVDVKVK